MLHTITLTLARCREHPEGSSGRGYEILGPGGRLDADLWRRERDLCRVRRFWTGEADRHGRLVHRAGGRDGATWLVDYDERTTDDDEPAFRLDTHHFVEDDYVSFRDADDGAMRTFKVARVGPERRNAA